jgi:hypothetical protein
MLLTTTCSDGADRRLEHAPAPPRHPALLAFLIRKAFALFCPDVYEQPVRDVMGPYI